MQVNVQYPTFFATFHEYYPFVKYLFFLRFCPLCTTESKIFSPHQEHLAVWTRRLSWVLFWGFEYFGKTWKCVEPVKTRFVDQSSYLCSKQERNHKITSTIPNINESFTFINWLLFSFVEKEMRNHSQEGYFNDGFVSPFPKLELSKRKRIR